MFLKNEKILCNYAFVGLTMVVHCYSDDKKIYKKKQTFCDEAFIGLATKIRWCSDEVTIASLYLEPDQFVWYYDFVTVTKTLLCLGVYLQKNGFHIMGIVIETPSLSI